MHSSGTSKNGVALHTRILHFRVETLDDKTRKREMSRSSKQNQGHKNYLLLPGVSPMCRNRPFLNSPWGDHWSPFLLLTPQSAQWSRGWPASQPSNSWEGPACWSWDASQHSSYARPGQCQGSWTILGMPLCQTLGTVVWQRYTSRSRNRETKKDPAKWARMVHFASLLL